MSLPRRPRSEARADPRRARVVFPIRVSASELELLNRAVRVNRQTRAAFIRDAVIGAAYDCLEIDEPRKSE